MTQQQRLRAIWTDQELARYIIKQARRHFRDPTDREIAIDAAWARVEIEAMKRCPDTHKRRLAYRAIHNLYERRRLARIPICTRICTYPPKNMHS